MPSTDLQIEPSNEDSLAASKALKLALTALQCASNPRMREELRMAFAAQAAYWQERAIALLDIPKPDQIN